MPVNSGPKWRQTGPVLKIVGVAVSGHRRPMETSNEELLAGNEELLAGNEEPQSVNEELHTVNTEYQSKIALN